MQRKTDEEQMEDLERLLTELQERAKHAEMAVGEKVHEVGMLTETLQVAQVGFHSESSRRSAARTALI